MLLMVSGGLGLGEVARRFPDSTAWQVVARQVDHARWHGCTLWDLIMPAFLFIVGAAVPFSIASRQRRGQVAGIRFAHAAWRSIVLVLLGIFIVSNGMPRTEFHFINVLAQIGLGYWLVFILAECSLRVQIAAFILILVGYGAWFFRYPLPGESFDFAAAGVPAGWQRMEGVAAHWELNTNPAAAFDRWLLNLFPRGTISIPRRRRDDAQLHSLNCHDAARRDGRQLAACGSQQLTKSARTRHRRRVAPNRRRRARPRHPSWNTLHTLDNLPDCQTNLDAVVRPLQRRLGRARRRATILDRRCARIWSLDVSIRRRGSKLTRNVYVGGAGNRLGPTNTAHSLGTKHAGLNLWINCRMGRRNAGVLAGVLVAVSPTCIHPNMMERLSTLSYFESAGVVPN